MSKTAGAQAFASEAGPKIVSEEDQKRANSDGQKRKSEERKKPRVIRQLESYRPMEGLRKREQARALEFVGALAAALNWLEHSPRGPGRFLAQRRLGLST